MTNQNALSGSIAELATTLQSQIDSLNGRIITGNSETVFKEASIILEQLNALPGSDPRVVQMIFDTLYQGFNALLWKASYQNSLEVVQKLQEIADKMDMPLLVIRSKLASAKAYYMLGFYEKAYQYLEPALDLAINSGFKKELAECLLEKSWYMFETRYPKESAQLKAEALSVAKEAGDPTLYADCLYYRGKSLAADGQVDEADQAFKEAVNIYKQTGNNRGVGRVYRQIMYLVPEDQKDTRQEFLQKSISMAEKHQDKAELAAACSMAGWEVLEEDSKLSIEYFNRSLKLYSELEDKVGMRNVYNGMATYYHHYHQYSDSRKYYQYSIELAEKVEAHFSVSDSYLFIGFTYFDEENYQDAQFNFEKSLQEYMIPGKGSKEDLTIRAYWLALAHCMQGNTKQAEDYFKNTVEGYTNIEDWVALANAYYEMGKSFRSQGDLKRAYDYLLKSVDVFHKTDDVSGLINSYDELVSIGFEEPNYEFSIRILDILIKLNEELDNKAQLASNYKDQAACRYNQNAYEVAVEDYVKALNIYLELKDMNQAAHTYADLADTVFKLDRFNDALNFYSEALNIAKKEKMIDLAAVVYEGMADVYYAVDNFKEAAENYMRAKAAYEVGYEDHMLDISEEELNENMARCYRKTASSAWLNDWDADAVEFYKKALEAYKKIENDLQVAVVNNRLGEIYAEYPGSQQDAIAFYTDALGYYEAFEDDKMIVAEINEELGKLHYGQGDIKKAQTELQAALDLYFNAGDEEGVVRVQEWLDKIG